MSQYNVRKIPCTTTLFFDAYELFHEASISSIGMINQWLRYLTLSPRPHRLLLLPWLLDVHISYAREHSSKMSYRFGTDGHVGPDVEHSCRGKRRQIGKGFVCDSALYIDVFEVFQMSQACEAVGVETRQLTDPY